MNVLCFTDDGVLSNALEEVFDIKRVLTYGQFSEQLLSTHYDATVIWGKDIVVDNVPACKLVISCNKLFQLSAPIRVVVNDRTFNVPSFGKQEFYAYTLEGCTFNVSLPELLPYARDVYDCLWQYEPKGFLVEVHDDLKGMRPAERRKLNEVVYEKVSLFCPVTCVHETLIHPLEDRYLTSDELERLQGGPIDCVPKGFAEWLTNQIYFCVSNQWEREEIPLQFTRYDRYSDKVCKTFDGLREHNLSGFFGNFDDKRFARWKQQHNERLGLYGEKFYRTGDNRENGASSTKS